ncbi:tetratricopeptide repeat protein [Gracilinema caldarium]|uniref:Tetratricopeptide TPR_2 repeat-containing protein n=1 Tax=Gracilinema caldarium (strain ATCC 51460 / DSM 7334 / H1) TaxID=744872 RepID=F8F1X5_GRAC1|nr:tetratricopeptide repeat protein [Gracilinema caldarium]AEJ19822.1 Tetratricopeptide TPR_2 repeat-containing protein [Gracilinema caldarium DSM 7334]
MKKSWIVVLILVVIVTVAVGGYIIRRNASWGALAVRIAEMGNGGAPPETIEGLKKAITVYGDRIEMYARDVAQIGIYWKILSVRLMDRKLYGEALETLKEAIRLQPEDATLHYLFGLSSSILAKSTYGKEKESYFSQAEAAHLRAIELDTNYARPRYAIGVLYVFELNRPEAAIPHLKRYLELQTRDVDAMFILARAYYMTGDLKEALSLYDRIIAITRDTSKKSEAENNKKIILEQLYE